MSLRKKLPKSNIGVHAWTYSNDYPDGTFDEAGISLGIYSTPGSSAKRVFDIGDRGESGPTAEIDLDRLDSASIPLYITVNGLRYRVKYDGTDGLKIES